jgi:hypothetical protein
VCQRQGAVISQNSHVCPNEDAALHPVWSTGPIPVALVRCAGCCQYRRQPDRLHFLFSPPRFLTHHPTRFPLPSVFNCFLCRLTRKEVDLILLILLVLLFGLVIRFARPLSGAAHLGSGRHPSVLGAK